MAKDTKKENPLMSKNIPRPPATPERQIEANGRTVDGENDTMVERENGKTVEHQNARTVKEQTVIDTQGEEKATIELSLYLRPSQDDKLDDLQRAYKRQTGKRIHRNDIMRKLIEKATVEDLF